MLLVKNVFGGRDEMSFFFFDLKWATSSRLHFIIVAFMLFFSCISISCTKKNVVLTLKNNGEKDFCCELMPFTSGSKQYIVLPRYWSFQDVHEQINHKEGIIPLFSDIPLVCIETESGSMKSINSSEDHSVKESGRIKIFDKRGVIYDGELKKIQGRGNSTWRMKKKPYKIKTAGKISMGRLKKANEFNLLANQEPSSLHNEIAFSMIRNLKFPDTIGSAYVHLYLNGYYNGLYLMTNKVTIDKSSIDIHDLQKETASLNPQKLKKYNRISGNLTKKPVYSKKFSYKGKIPVFKAFDIPYNPLDITGGYLLYVFPPERVWKDRSSGFVSHNNTPVSLQSPKYATKEQVCYIQDFFSCMEDVLYGEEQFNNEPAQSLKEYIDVKSFARYYIMKEFTLEGDGGVGSVYMYKTSVSEGGKLCAGPLWDFDSSMGEDVDFEAQNPKAIFVGAPILRDGRPVNNIFTALCQREDFKEVVRECYVEEFYDIIKSYFEKEYDDLCSFMKKEIGYNELLWHVNDKEYDEKCSQIKETLLTRLHFLDSIWSHPEDFYTVSFDTGCDEVEHREMIFYVKKGNSFTVPICDAHVCALSKEVEGKRIYFYGDSAYSLSNVVHVDGVGNTDRQIIVNKDMHIKQVFDAREMFFVEKIEMYWMVSLKFRCLVYSFSVIFLLSIMALNVLQKRRNRI